MVKKLLPTLAVAAFMWAGSWSGYGYQSYYSQPYWGGYGGGWSYPVSCIGWCSAPNYNYGITGGYYGYPGGYGGGYYGYGYGTGGYGQGYWW